ncbi:MAG: hypothetical protein AAFQ31_06855 [Planctomycetota bacterium]
MKRTGMAVGLVFVAVLVAGALALNRVDGADGARDSVAQPVASGDAVDRQPDWRETAVHMRLQDDLDRPEDGWCLDVVGSGPHIRFDMPLIAHNIKPGLYADEAVAFTAKGQIRFPAYPGSCVTVMGLNEFALPGAALMLKPCGEDIPF